MRRRVWLPVAWMIATGLPAFAQTGEAAAPPDKPDPSLLLSRLDLAPQRYVDGSFGFAMRPFGECDILRHKRLDPDGNVELVQFFQYDLNWGMTVRLYRADRPLNADGLVSALEAALIARFKDVQVERRDKVTIAARNGARIAAQTVVKDEAWFLQAAAVPLSPIEYFAILFNAPMAHRQHAEPLFGRIVGSFEIIRSELTQELLQGALRRGEALLRATASASRGAWKLVPENDLRIVSEGRDAGFVHMQEQAGEVNGRRGVMLQADGAVFDTDGKVTLQRNSMFLSDDLTYERWENMVQVLIPAKDSRPVRSFVSVEQAVRESNRLVVAFSDEPNASELSDRVLETPASYAPAAFVVLFPRLVDRKTAQLFAFATYNSERRGLVLRTLRVVGPRDLMIDGKSVRTTRIEDSEGLVPPVQEHYVDANGRLVRISADDGKLEMVATPSETIHRLYDRRMQEVDKMLKDLAAAAEAEAKANAAKGRGNSAQPGDARPGATGAPRTNAPAPAPTGRTR